MTIEINTTGTGPATLTAMVANAKSKFEPSPREHVIEHIFQGLADAWHHKNPDGYQVAMDLLEWIEERAAAREPTGELIFINPDMPTGVLDPKTGKIMPLA